MAEQAYAYVTLIPVAKGFQKELAKELGGVEKLGSKTGKEFSKGFGKAADKLSTGIIAGFAAAAVGAGLLLKSSISQASDLEESLNALSVAYGESSASIVKLGEDSASRLGVTQSAFNASAVRFSAFAERIVGAGGNVAGFVDKITTRASDFASVFNIDVSEALQVFQSGLSGEAEPLKRFGINLLDTEVSAFALANGIGEVGTALTETEKTQARYGLIMQETAKTQGDFANTSDGLANSQRILSAEFTDLQASIGTALLPVMATLVNQIKDELVPIVERFGDWLQSPEGINAVAEFGEAMKDALDFSVDFTTGLADNLSVLIKVGTGLLAASVAWKAYRGAMALATVAQVRFNIAALKNPYVIAAVALATLTGGIIAFTGEMSDAEDASDEAAGTLKRFNNTKLNLITGEIIGVRDAALEAANAMNGINRGELIPASPTGQNTALPGNPRPGQVYTGFYGRPGEEVWFTMTWDGKKWGPRKPILYNPPKTNKVKSSGPSQGDLKKVIEETRQAYKDARANYNEIVVDANKDFTDRNNDILDSYNDAVGDANEAFTKRSADIVEDYSEAISQATNRRDNSMADALKSYNQGIVDTNAKFASDQEAIIQKSIDRLRDGFKSAVSVNVASIFDSDAIAGSVDGLVETLRDKLAGSKNLLSNAAKLSSAGFSQTFIEQVVGAGTDVGNELANAILTSTPETVSELKNLYGQIETTSETGMDALSQTIYDKTGLATTALQGLYDQTFIDLANSLTDQKAAYIEQQAAIQREFNSSIAQAETTRTEAMADANLALQESIANAKEYRDEALLETQERLNEALLTAAEDFEDDIKNIAKVFREQVIEMKAVASGLAAQINGIRGALSMAASQARSVAASAAAAISASSSIGMQPRFLAEGGLVTSATSAIIGEAGPEVVIPLDRFESMMGMSQQGKAVNYYAAPNQSIDSEQDLFQAMRRAKVVAGW